ncbi:MAG: hypothetical protein R3190_19650, partial [Thermoanaerobaculia bacterium]|nr:hypothetical protein [Thermoanaerobaculia bacterium]
DWQVRRLRADLSALTDADGNGGEVYGGDADAGEPWQLVRAGRRHDTAGLLVVDATGIVRGGGPSLASPQGEALEGLTVLSPRYVWRLADGTATPLSCP